MSLEINLKVKAGKDSYFIVDDQRLEKLNRSLLESDPLSRIVQEDESTFWIRKESFDSDDTVWIEATRLEVQKFLDGDESFFKEEIGII